MPNPEKEKKLSKIKYEWKGPGLAPNVKVETDQVVLSNGKTYKLSLMSSVQLHDPMSMMANHYIAFDYLVNDKLKNIWLIFDPLKQRDVAREAYEYIKSRANM